MTDDSPSTRSLQERFRKYAIAYTMLSVVDDKPLAEQAHEEFVDFCDEIERSGRLSELRPLLEDPHPAVRLVVAIQLIDEYPHDALPILESFAHGTTKRLRRVAQKILRIARRREEKLKLH